MGFGERLSMSTTRFSSDDGDLVDLYGQLADNDFQPLWRLHGLLTPEPVVQTRPHRWDAGTLQRLAALSGQLVGIDRGGDRRVLACANPGLGGAPFASSTLWAAVQYLGPGEVAPAHRHSPAALRFVLAGEGVWTLVDGDPLHMLRGDLLLTPSMTFHEHHNPGDEPMMWMDVLDLPIVAALDAVFYEDGPSEAVDARTDLRSQSELFFGAGSGLLPVTRSRPSQSRHSPLLAYRWEQTERALKSQLDATGEDEATIRYADPTTGRDVMPTMRCEMTRLRPGTASVTRRQTGSRVATVFNGHGSARIGTEVFDLGPGDLFVIPSWTRYTYEAATELDIFSTSDAPVLEVLAIYRETEG